MSILIRHLQELPEIFLQKGCIATIGNFDGFHLGHQEILKKIMRIAKQKNCFSLVITFEPYPKEFFTPKNAPPRLSRLRDKIKFCEQLGIDYILCLKFNQALANIPAEDFVSNVLIKACGIKGLIVGSDFHFGKNRQGNYSFLQTASQKYNFELFPTPDFIYDNRRISSTWIRDLLAQGYLQKAEELLGHPFVISGKVIKGSQRGRIWGIPTANILLNQQNLPFTGIFAVKLKITSILNEKTISNTNEQVFLGAASIGIRPMFAEPRGILEVHLFDFSGNLYGAHAEVSFLKKIRDEEIFTSEAELIKKIHHDLEICRNFFNESLS